MKYYIKYIFNGDNKLAEFDSKFDAQEWWMNFSMENDLSGSSWIESFFYGEIIKSEIKIDKIDMEKNK